MREFAEAEIAPYAAEWDRDHTLPAGDRGEDGRARSLRSSVPGGASVARGRLHQPVRRHRGDRPGRSVDGHHARGRRRTRDQPDRDVRLARAEGSNGCPTCFAGRALAAFGLTEPGQGRMPGNPQDHAPCSTATSWVINGSKAFITNSGTDITSVITVTARTGPGRDQHPSGPRRDTRSHGRACL